jgi:hypothetical protein
MVSLFVHYDGKGQIIPLVLQFHQTNFPQNKAKHGETPCNNQKNMYNSPCNKNDERKEVPP